MKFAAAALLTLITATASAGSALTCTGDNRTLTVTPWSAGQLPVATLAYSENKLIQVGDSLKIVKVDKTASAECQVVPQTDEPAFICELLSDTGTNGFHVSLSDIGDGTFSAAVTPWGVMYGNAQPQPLNCQPQN
jgi:hypothetical protein